MTFADPRYLSIAGGAKDEVDEESIIFDGSLSEDSKGIY